MRPVELRRARLSALLAAQASVPGPSSGALAIASCKAYIAREPVSGREYAILKIQTAGGVAGWGETRSLPAADLAQASGILRGRQATEFVPLHTRLSALPNMQAAVNMALLDIVGQAANAPVYQVLGGPTRHKARALATLAGADDAALVAALNVRKPPGSARSRSPPLRLRLETLARRSSPRNRTRLEALRAAAGEDRISSSTAAHPSPLAMPPVSAVRWSACTLCGSTNRAS